MTNILDPVTNFAIAVIDAIDASATTANLASGKGALFPAPATDGAFNVTIFNSTDYRSPSDDPNKEIIRITARSTDALTFTRAQEGTSAATHNTGGKVYKIVLTNTAKNRTDAENSLQTIPAKSGWIPISGNNWAYASATTITVPSGAAALYQIGDKFTVTANSVVLYGYIVGVADTLLTVVGNAMTNFTFSNVCYSRADNPFGFPSGFDYTCTLTVAGGTAPQYATVSNRFYIKGRTCFVDNIWIDDGGNEGSGSAAIVGTLPVAMALSTGAAMIGVGCYSNGGASVTKATFIRANSTTSFKHTLYDQSNYVTGADQTYVTRNMSAQIRYEI